MTTERQDSPHGDTLDPLIVAPNGQVSAPAGTDNVTRAIAVQRAYEVYGKTGNPELLVRLGIWSA